MAGVSSVASRYDVMNDLMSGGLLSVVEARSRYRSRVFARQRVLDVAGGTADLSLAFARRVGNDGQVH